MPGSALVSVGPLCRLRPARCLKVPQELGHWDNRLPAVVDKPVGLERISGLRYRPGQWDPEPGQVDVRVIVIYRHEERI
jgi:hypothetical protein